MLNQVKIFDGKGKLKQIITKDAIANRHWKFYKTNNIITYNVIFSLVAVY